jgi:hypothetical protein
MSILLKALFLSSVFSFGAVGPDPLRNAELENAFVGSYRLTEDSMAINSCSGVEADQTYDFTINSPSGFDVLRDVGVVAMPGENIQVTKEIQSLSDSDQILMTQTTVRSHKDGREVGIQLITMLPKSFERGAPSASKEILPVIYVKYQYFIIDYSLSGLIEKMSSVQECTFKKLP